MDLEEPTPMSADEPPLAYVLDDEPQIAAIIAKILAGAGYEPRQFSSAPPFLKETESVAPQLIVLDVSLGDTDAIEVIQQLASRQYQGKVLVISGRKDNLLDEILEIGQSRGLRMVPPLKKPFRVAQVRKHLGETVDFRATSTAPSKASAPTFELAEILERRWLEVWYQPKIDLKSLAVSGAEALVRARHPEFGMLSPSVFLPPPSDPLHQDLFRFVLSRAMTDWGKLAVAGLHLQIAVNVPASVLHTPGFVRSVRQLLPKDKNFPGLILEVTEDDVIKHPELIREVATHLKLYDVSLAIDDFGSAYSTLSRLLDLPFVELKLDRAFVMDCSSDPKKWSICRAVIDLAHKLDGSVCAEGVEQPEDLRSLVSMGCDTAQGYLFAKPMDFASFIKSTRL